MKFFGLCRFVLVEFCVLRLDLFLVNFRGEDFDVGFFWPRRIALVHEALELLRRQ